MRGKIIEFEGLDASFKETNVKALHTYLLGKGIKVNYVSFPRHNTSEGIYIDKMLQGEYGNIHRDIIKTMFALDRFDYIKCNNVEKRLEEGEWFIFDRYTGSSVIYQTAEVKYLKQRRIEQMDIYEYEYVKLDIPEPDIVIAMHSDFDMMMNVIKEKEDTDKFEQDKEYLKKVYDCFIQCIDDYGWKRIDTHKDFPSETIFKSKITIFEEVLNILRDEKIL